MLKKKIAPNSLRLGLLLFFFSPLYMFAQQKPDYKLEYQNRVLSVVGHDARRQAAINYFQSLANTELADALADIATLGNENFIAYDLFALNEDALKNDAQFRNDLLEHLNSIANTPEFRLVTIDFIEDVLSTQAEAKKFEGSLRSIALQESLPAKLRSYAVSHLSIFPHDSSKQIIRQLLEHEETQIAEGAGRACRALLWMATEQEKNDWTSALISAVEKHREKLEKIKPIIYALGKIGTNTSIAYLQRMLEIHAQAGNAISNTITLSLTQNMDTELFIDIYRIYSQNKSNFLDTYAVELTLSELARQHPEILQELSGGQTIEGKKTFLQALQALRETSSQNYVEKAVQLLNDDTDRVRLAAVKAVHFLLPYEDEVMLFKERLQKEPAEPVRQQIYSYIGRKR